MNNSQRGSANVVLIAIIIVLLAAVGYLVYLEKLERIQAPPLFAPDKNDSLPLAPVDSNTYIYSKYGFSIELPKEFTPREEASQTGPALAVSLPVGGLAYISNTAFWEESNIPSYTYIKDQKNGDNTFKVYTYEGGVIYWLNKGRVGYEFSASETDKLKLENLLTSFKLLD